MGARLAVRTAGQFPGTVAAVGGFHGARLVTDESDSPHLAIADRPRRTSSATPTRTRSMTIDDVDALEEALQDAGREHLNEIYDGAAHGYSMADTSTYDDAATERHFAVLRDLFAAQPLA